MLDLQALPIAIALTLWDAAPIYLCVGLALAVLSRAILPTKGFHTAWALRDAAGIEGLVYVVIFQPTLAPVVAIVATCQSVLTLTSGQTAEAAPRTPGEALSRRASEMFGALLLAATIAGAIKILAPSLPEHLAVEALLALAAGSVLGRRTGMAAVPAVAMAVHMGGLLPAALCLAATLARPVFAGVIRPYRRAQHVP